VGLLLVWRSTVIYSASGRSTILIVIHLLMSRRRIVYSRT